MELRSRSTTPFLQNELIEESNNMSFTTTTRVTRQSKLKTTGIDESYSTTKTRGGRSRQQQQYDEGNNYYKNRKTTSDYYSSSSEDNDLNCIQHVTENEKNQIIEDAIAASDNHEISALNLYRKAGRYWDKYPKTDWTYSPHSKDRVEIAPGVVAMPNMSRRTIHSSLTDSNQTTNYTSTIINNSTSKLIKPQQLFPNETNNRNGYDECDYYYYNSKEEEQKITQTKRLSLFIYTKILIIFTTIQNCFNYINNSTVIWFGSKLHHFVSWIMLIDTWLLKKQTTTTTTKRNKLKNVIVLCLIPLLLFGGTYILLASGVSLAPSCHPHCGRLASAYFNSIIQKLYS